MKSTAVIAMIAIAVVAVAAAGTVLMVQNDSNNHADVTVYTDDDVSVTVSGKSGNTVLSAVVESGKSFEGWYDADGKLLSTSATYSAKMSDGDVVYAYTSTYVTVEPGTYDLKELMDVSGNGTFSVKSMDENGAEFTVDGSEITLSGCGTYDVTYTGSTAHRCCHLISDETEEHTYTWSYKSVSYKLTLEISYSDYVHYVRQYIDDRSSHYLNVDKSSESMAHDVSYVAYDSLQNKYIKQISDYILSKTDGMSQQYVANVVLAFSQCITYTSDSVVHGIDEYFQFPLETLYLGTGDCEDTSFLYCAVAEYTGFDTCLFLFNNHMATGTSLDSFTADSLPMHRDSIKTGVYGWSLDTGTDTNGDAVQTMFYYGETTASGWYLGEVPASEYDSYLIGCPLSQYGGRTVDFDVVTSDGVTYVSSTSAGSTFTTVTATVTNGTEFRGWFDSKGALLTSSLTYRGEICEGDVLYALSGPCANTDHPVKSRETVSLPEVTGITGEGTWSVVTDGASVNGTECIFNNSGTYFVTLSGATSWVGLVYAYADVTLYTCDGLSATVTGGDLCTIVAVTVSDGTTFNGIYTSEEQLSDEPRFQGDVANGTTVYILSSDYVAVTTPDKSVSLVEASGVSGSGTWHVLSSSFEDVSGKCLSDGSFSSTSPGAYIITYADTGTTWCGLVCVNASGLYSTYKVSGWYLTSWFFGTRQTEISGNVEIDHVYYSQTRDSYFMHQTYSWSTGSSGTAKYWSGDEDYKDYKETALGVYDKVTANYGTVRCNVWQVSYLNDDGYTVTETQYMDTSNTYVIYMIEVDYSSDGTTYQHLTYDLSGYGFRDMQEEFTLRAYSDNGVTVTCGDVSEYADELKLTASVAEGYTFMGWYDENMNCLSTSLTYDGEDIYAEGEVTIFARTTATHNIMTDGTVDLKTVIDVDGNGTWAVKTTSMKDVSGVSITNGVADFGDNHDTYILTYTDDDSCTYRMCTIFTDYYVTNTFMWTYDGNPYMIDLDILYSDYAYYVNAYSQSERRSEYSSFTKDTTHAASFVCYGDVQNKYLDVISKYIKEKTEGKSQQYVADVIKAFCSSDQYATMGIKYVSDKSVYGEDEYWQFPLETLFLMTGDCEDTAILFASLAKYMGYDVCLFLFSDHLAAGVVLDSFVALSGHTTDNRTTNINGKDYYFVETTSRKSYVGDVWTSEYDNKFIIGFAIA